jgi:hypothetical protein
LRYTTFSVVVFFSEFENVANFKGFHVHSPSVKR